MSLLNRAELSSDQVAGLTADIRAHSNEQVLESGCPAPPEEQLVLVVRDKDGDVLVLPQTCEEGFAWLDRLWTPTQATLDMLRTALR